MPPTAIDDLLRRFVSHQSEAAFRMLVERYLPLVHAAALRRSHGNSALARDIAQDVFIALAKKAHALEGRTTLAPWLLSTTHLAALQHLRKEQRRLEREQKAYTMEQSAIAEEDIDWTTLRPLLDGLLSELGQKDQEAIFLRFFEGLSFAQIGERLDIGEDGARRRSSRALEKLRAQLSRRGIRSTTAICAQALVTQYVASAPSGLTSSIAAAALAGTITPAGAAAAPLLILSMNASKIAVVSLSLIAIAGLGGTAFYAHRHVQSDARTRSLQQEHAALYAEARDLRSHIQKSSPAIAQADAAEPTAGRGEKSPLPPTQPAQKAAHTISATPPNSVEELLAQIDHVLAHPELRPAFVRQIVQQLWGEDQRFFATEGVSPLQIDAIKDEAAAYAALLLDARAKRIGGEDFAGLFAAADDQSLAQVRRILGEDTFARLREYKAGANENRLVDQLAVRLYYTDTPLTGAQASQLASILVQARFSTDRSGLSQTVAGRAVSEAEHAAFRQAQSGQRVALITDAAIARARAEGSLPAITLEALQAMQANQSAQLQLAKAATSAK